MAASTASAIAVALGASSGGSWWTNASVSRTDPSGKLVRNPTSPSAASTISVEPPPMSTTDERRRRERPGTTSTTARNVSAASRSPSMTSTGVPRISAAGPRNAAAFGARRSASVPTAAMRAS